MEDKKEIKYRLEYHPNPNCCEIHLNTKILSNETRIIYSETDSEAELAEKNETIALKLLELLTNIEGIESIFIKKFSVDLTKGEAFDWEDMIPIVLNTINCCIGTDKILIEKASPIIHPELTPEEIANMNRMNDSFFDDID